jgi:NADH-quinone oxidoreductase subunit N
METLNLIRPELLTFSTEQIRTLWPYLIVFSGAILAILGSVLKGTSSKWPVFFITLITCGFGIYHSSELMREPGMILFNGMMVSDAYSHFFNAVFLSATLFTAFASFKYLDQEQMQYPEYFVLLLFSALGMMLMVSSLDLIVLFIALELMSLCVYALVGFRRNDRRSNEAAMKYFILGSVASAVFLYGAALLYGSTGSTDLNRIFDLLQDNPLVQTPVYVLGLVLVVFGFLFKVAAVPFHMWMPDVYEGAPTPVTGFMTTGLKAAAFAIFLRVLVTLGYGRGFTQYIQTHIHDLLWVIAALTMLVGNVVALTQTHLKRMLAYSSIAHTGYLLVGIVAGVQGELGFYPVVMYLVSYAVMNLGAFVVLTILGQRSDTGLNLHDLSGISRQHPWLAFCMAVFLFSMAGIPPTAGFAAKYMLLYSAVQAGEIPLVVIAVLCSAISVYYYLRVLVYMYMREPAGSPSQLRTPLWTHLALMTMVVLTLQIGVLPGKVIHLAKKAVMSI